MEDERSLDDDLAAMRQLRDEARLAIVEGLLSALDQWDEIGRQVGASADREEALGALMALGFAEDVAQHVMDMRIVSRTATSRAAWESERASLRSHLERR